MSTFFAAGIIIVCIAFLVVLTILKVNVLVAAPLAAVLLSLLSGMPIIESLLSYYGPGVASFVSSYIILFICSAIFGKIYEDTGMAMSIAKGICSRVGTSSLGVILAVYFVTCLLVYGGISLFCVVFAVFPIALAIFKEANVSRHIIPACIFGGLGTWAATFSPGNPQNLQIIACNALGTTPMSEAGLGFILVVFMIALHVLIFWWYDRRCKKKNITFENDPEIAGITEKFEGRALPNFWLSLLPMITVVVLLNLVSLDIIICLIAGIAVGMLVGWKYYDGKKINAANVGASNAVSALLNTAVVIGFGSLVQVTPAFEVVKTAILGMEGSPVLSFALATTLLAGACASGTGGMAISLQTLAPSYLAMGVPAGVLQRIALTASCTLDSLPHNGALYSCFSVCKSDHRHAYFLTMLLSVVATTLTMIVGVVIASVWYV